MTCIVMRIMNVRGIHYDVNVLMNVRGMHYDVNVLMNARVSLSPSAAVSPKVLKG